MGVIEDHKLKSVTDRLGRHVQELEETVNRPTVRVFQQSNVATGRCLGGIMGLRRLVKYKDAGNRAVLLPKPTMESQQSNNMIPNPVLPATNPVQMNWSLRRLRHYGEALEIEAYPPLGVLQV